MSSGARDFDLLLIGFSQELLDCLKPFMASVHVRHLSSSEQVAALLEDYQLGDGAVVLISHELKGMTHFEAGQALSNYFPGTNLVFITLERAKLELKNLKKNGFTESFFWPVDKRPIFECIQKAITNRTGAWECRYKAVKLLDLQPGQELPFEVRTFLPLNNKFVLLTGSGKLSEKKVALLKQRNVNSVFIDSKQVDKFYSHAADQLIHMGTAHDSVTSGEREGTIRATVRDLLSALVDSTSHDLVTQSKTIVANYVVKKSGVDLSEQLAAVMGEGGDVYLHAQVVSTVACLLSIATGVGKPEDLAVAGLFHDIGVESAQKEVSIFDVKTLTEEQQAVFYAHPSRSVALLREKSVSISPEITAIIERHHEGPESKDFSIEAQLLAYADAFEYLTRPRAGHTRPEIAQIHQTICEKLNPSSEIFAQIGRFLIAG